MKRILFTLVSTLLCITSFAQIGYKTKEGFVEFTADDTNCVFKLQKELTTKQKMKLKTQVSLNDYTVIPLSEVDDFSDKGYISNIYHTKNNSTIKNCGIFKTIYYNR